MRKDIDVGVNAIDGSRIDFQEFAETVSDNYAGAFVIEEERGGRNWHLHMFVNAIVSNNASDPAHKWIKTYKTIESYSYFFKRLHYPDREQ